MRLQLRTKPKVEKRIEMLADWFTMNSVIWVMVRVYWQSCRFQIRRRRCAVQNERRRRLLWSTSRKGNTQRIRQITRLRSCSIVQLLLSDIVGAVATITAAATNVAGWSTAATIAVATSTAARIAAGIVCWTWRWSHVAAIVIGPPWRSLDGRRSGGTRSPRLWSWTYKWETSWLVNYLCRIFIADQLPETGAWMTKDCGTAWKELEVHPTE